MRKKCTFCGCYRPEQVIACPQCGRADPVSDGYWEKRDAERRDQQIDEAWPEGSAEYYDAARLEKWRKAEIDSQKYPRWKRIAVDKSIYWAPLPCLASITFLFGFFSDIPRLLSEPGKINLTRLILYLVAAVAALAILYVSSVATTARGRKAQIKKMERVLADRKRVLGYGNQERSVRLNQIDQLFILTNTEIPIHWKEDYLNQVISMRCRFGVYKELMTNSTKIMSLVGGEIDYTDSTRVFMTLAVSGKVQNPKEDIERMTFGDFNNGAGLKGCVVARFERPFE